MKCRKENDHLIDLQIDGTMTIKDTLQEIQYEYVDCIHLAMIQWHDVILLTVVDLQI
jgi:hypothetical protein